MIYSPEAMEDLRDLYEHIAADNRQVAGRVVARIAAGVEKLADRLFEGPATRLTTGETVRSWPVIGYRIYYQRRPEALYVVRIYHGAREPIAEP